MSYIPFEFVIALNGILITGVITVFTFAVTLLGKAIQLAEDEQSRVQAERTQSFQERISDLQHQLDEAKKKGNPKELENELIILTQERVNYDKTISQIKVKYSYLNFHEAIINPSLFFILSMLLAQIGSKFYQGNITNAYAQSLFFVGSLVALFPGLYRFSRSLLLVQEISSKNGRESSFNPEKLPQMIQEAIAKHEEELREKTREKLEIKFNNIAPYSCMALKEYELNFGVKLTQGKIIRNVAVWFFIPDLLTFVSPSEKTSWRQRPEYDLPNIKTAKVIIGDVSIGAIQTRTLKIKMPALSGSYTIYYRLYADGYQERRHQITINVV